MSFFSKKLPDYQKNIVNNTTVIKTMQDDLNAINGVSSQENYSKISLDKNQDLLMVNEIQSKDSNKNPFIQQEQVSFKEQSFVDNGPLYIAGDKNTAQFQTNTHHTLKIVVSLIVLIFFISIGGVFYFIKTRALPVENTPQDTQIPQEQLVTNEEKKSVLFSIDTPNYLPIDTIASTSDTGIVMESIQSTLLQTAQQVSALKSDKPVEFFISDTNNNPVSFTDFTRLSGIHFSQAILDALNDKFSLFIFIDNNIPHLGLSIEIKDAVALQMALTQEEAGLPSTLAPLFLSDTPSLQTIQPFNDGIYKDIPLRYTNLHPETTLSVDYALVNQHLIIGTSMQTHHALIDRIK